MPTPQQEFEARRTLSELSSDYSYSLRVEPDGTFVTEWMTDAVERITGYTFDEIQARGWRPIRHPDDAQLVDRWREVVRSGHDAAGEWRIVRKDGDVRWISTIGRAKRDARTGVVNVVGTTQDVTERKQLEEERRAYSARLELEVGARTRELSARLVQAQRLCAAGEVSAAVAYGIINPLTALLGTVALAREESLRGDRKLERIHQLAERIKGVVDGALARSEPQASEGQVQAPQGGARSEPQASEGQVAPQGSARSEPQASEGQVLPPEPR